MEERPELRVLRRLREEGKVLAAAESCTGGLIAKRMTDLPGASQVFCGGVVSYTNEVKKRVLRVPDALLDRFGAVSEPVARAMAEGVCAVTGADVGVSVTGVAGPDRDDRDNPVGTVFLAVSHAGQTVCRRFAFGETQSRAAIRDCAADAAFALVLEALSAR